MRIGIIGGAERNLYSYERALGARGHVLEFHGGHMRGRGAEALESLVLRCDIVVIITEINSHNAVLAARKLVARHARPSMLVRTFGISRLMLLVDAMEAQQQRESALARAV